MPKEWHCSNQELAETQRLVCKKLKCISESILNQVFLNLDKRIPETIDKLNLLLESSNAPMRYICVKRDELEIVQYDYKIVKAVVWRHIYYNQPRLCSLYAGRYIDSIETILNRPNHKHMPTEINIVQYYSKKFLDHFESTVEFKISKDWTKIGSKLLDLLECQELIAQQDRKEPPEVSIDLEKGIYKWKGEFFLTRAWYCVLSQNKPEGWQAEFKKMSRCLRRLLHRSGVYALYEFHCQRQFSLYNDFWSPMKSYYYSGFHRRSVTFYGCINTIATSTRAPYLINSDIRLYNPMANLQFNRTINQHREEPGDETNEDTDEEPNERERVHQLNEQNDLIMVYNMDGTRTVTRDTQNNRKKLMIKFKLECPLEVAPIRVIESLSSMNYTLRPQAEYKKLGFKQDIEISCNVSRNASLPFTYKWSTKFKDV